MKYVVITVGFVAAIVVWALATMWYEWAIGYPCRIGKLDAWCRKIYERGKRDAMIRIRPPQLTDGRIDLRKRSPADEDSACDIVIEVSPENATRLDPLLDDLDGRVMEHRIHRFPQVTHINVHGIGECSIAAALIIRVCADAWKLGRDDFVRVHQWGIFRRG